MAKLLIVEKLRVWYKSNLAEYNYSVANLDAAKLKINTLAECDLKNRNIEWNVMGLEVFEDGEWSEWYNEDGQGIDDIIDGDE